MPGPPCFSVCFLWLSYHISGPLNMLSGRSIGPISQCILVLGDVRATRCENYTILTMFPAYTTAIYLVTMSRTEVFSDDVMCPLLRTFLATNATSPPGHR